MPVQRPPRVWTFGFLLIAALVLGGAFAFTFALILVFARLTGPAPADQQGDIRVDLAGAEICPVLWADRFGGAAASSSDCLEIHVRVSNTHRTKLIRHESWLGGKATLEDDLGNSYAAIRCPLGYYIRSGEELLPCTVSVHPQESFTDALVFERPIRQARKLTLTLPRRSFGEYGKLVLTFPCPRAR